MMRIITFSLFMFLTAGFLTVRAEKTVPTQAHAAAHRQQLANAKLRMDKNVIKDFIKNDVERRELVAELGNPVPAATRALLADLLSEARTHMGKRYRSGSKGPKAFDCSGFSSYVFRQFGYELGSSSRDQFNDGTPVERRELREGDLVFFTGRNSRSKTVGHVGIVVTADNEKGTFKFIHASTSGGIQIDGSEGYYKHRFLGARRIIENEQD